MEGGQGAVERSRGRRRLDCRARLERLNLDIDPYANDPGRWGASLITLAELVVPLLDAASARSVVEVGAYAGDLTRLLHDWAAPRGGSVWAVDPAPKEPLERLAAEGGLRAYRHHGFWDCMDTYKDAVALNDLWEQGSAPWRVWDRTRVAST